MSHPRMYMELHLEEPPGTPEPSQALPPGFKTRNLNPDDGIRLGALIYVAYQGTVDDEGETLEEATKEATETLAGKYGPVRFDCSFGVLDQEQLASAVVVSDWKGLPNPFVSFTLTHPDHGRKGLAGSLMKMTLQALRAQGVPRLGLFVTKANTHAVHLYEKLGFRESPYPKPTQNP